MVFASLNSDTFIVANGKDLLKYAFATVLLYNLITDHFHSACDFNRKSKLFQIQKYHCMLLL